MKRCTICAALVPVLGAETVAYVRVLDGVYTGSRSFPCCPCCIARAKTHPAAVRDGLRRAYDRGVN